MRPIQSFATLLLLGIPTLAGAQDSIDSTRAYIPATAPYEPFYVTTSFPLANAVETGQIHDRTPLLVLTRGTERLALSVEQMAYHHIAQGEIGGEPWMVSF